MSFVYKLNSDIPAILCNSNIPAILKFTFLKLLTFLLFLLSYFLGDKIPAILN